AALPKLRDQGRSGCSTASTESNATPAATGRAPASLSPHCYGTASERRLNFMGHSKGRDNVKKRARRRKKTDRLALAKQPSPEAPARQGEKHAAK
ncbi:MAG TPA: hypothetical protein VGQ43_00695, partial [Candidatus Udaeobacter sp.]|nr:hypothetical protein [Candidatus Udaeobacter sp.]